MTVFDFILTTGRHSKPEWGKRTKGHPQGLRVRFGPPIADEFKDWSETEFAATQGLRMFAVALEKMIAAYPETRFSWAHDLPISGSRRDLVRSLNLFALFDCVLDLESGAYLSEDYSFCLRWRQDRD